MKEEHGFTLIEVLTVILIIGILAVISTPVFLHQRSRARQAEVMSAAHNLMVAVVANSTKYRGLYPRSIAYGNPAASTNETVYFTQEDPFRSENLTAWYKAEPGRLGYNFCLESNYVPNQHVEYTHITGSISHWIPEEGCEAALNVSGPGWVQLQ
ncbi:type II secretion system protein [Stomatohabitans albus]|uniref:type IV pilin protein n=1 Tax=Stomatohabitans albus TaxID=3110766 RepID=UPI00300D6C45